MERAAFKPGDRVTVLSGPFAGVSGTVATLAELVARWPDNNFADPVYPWPDIPTQQQVDRGEAYRVMVEAFGHDVPLLQFANQVTADEQR
jgi:transcription antitermination factor NusG